MSNPARCHCGSVSWQRDLEGGRFTCCSCNRPLWQPMEIAPKNGVFVLVFCHRPDGFMKTPDVAFAYWDEDEDSWQYEGEEMIPIYWMPLPDGPGK